MGNVNAGARALVLPFPQATSAYGADTVAAALTRATEGSRSTLIETRGHTAVFFRP